MKQRFSITIFLITILLSSIHINTSNNLVNNLKTSTKSTLISSIKLRSRAKDIPLAEMKEMWGKLFSKGREGSCTENFNTPDLKDKKDPFADDSDAEAKQSGWGFKRPSFAWLKKFGHGPVSYLFDYLDPVFKSDFIKETNMILKAINNFKKEDTEAYYDKFNLHLIAPKGNRLADDADFKAINEKFSKEIYDLSINSVQLNQALPQWGWIIPSNAADPAYDFIVKYDVNGDGRLSPSELILGDIWNNKNREGLYCYACYHLIAKKIGAIFDYVDCQGKGYLMAEELWQKLSSIKRKDNRWNIFRGGEKSIRSSCVNDLVLKNSYTIDGALTKNEFVSGILLGFWHRILNDKGVVENESRSLKDLRWSNNGQVDNKLAEYNSANRS